MIIGVKVCCSYFETTRCNIREQSSDEYNSLGNGISPEEEDL
jgi:hypothetical protein